MTRAIALDMRRIARAFALALLASVAPPPAATAESPPAAGAAASAGAGACSVLGDVPLYATGRNAFCRAIPGGALASLQTYDAPAAVAEFYAAFAAGAGWQPAPEIIERRQDGRLLLYRKEKLLLRIDAFDNPLDGATDIFVVLVTEPAPKRGPGETPQ